MKNLAISLVIVAGMFSCNSLQGVGGGSTLTSAAQLLGSLSSNSTASQITSLFGLLDSDKNNEISTTEATGSVSDNFSTLDTDNSSSINATELQGLLALLK